jgi:hypothetical protein
MATLGAQTPQTTAQTSPTSTTEQRSAMSDKAGDITITGCLAKSPDGRYTLKNARMDNGATDQSSTTTAGTTSTTAGTGSSTTAGTAAGTTAGTSGSTTAGTTTPSMAGSMSPEWVLAGGSDLDKHVGHKIQVTGRSASDSSMDHDRASGAVPPATGTTAGTAGSTAGTTASTAGTTGSRADQQPRLDVQSVKMISSSCP